MGSILLTWINFNSVVDKFLHTRQSMEWNYLSIAKHHAVIKVKPKGLLLLEYIREILNNVQSNVAQKLDMSRVIIARCCMQKPVDSVVRCVRLSLKEHLTNNALTIYGHDDVIKWKHFPRN